MNHSHCAVRVVDRPFVFFRSKWDEACSLLVEDDEVVIVSVQEADDRRLPELVVVVFEQDSAGFNIYQDNCV